MSGNQAVFGPHPHVPLFYRNLSFAFSFSVTMFKLKNEKTLVVWDNKNSKQSDTLRAGTKENFLEFFDCVMMKEL